MPTEINIISPSDGAVEVPRSEPIAFSVTSEASIPISNVNIFVRTEQVFSGDSNEFISGYKLSTYEANGQNGWDFNILPSRQKRWRDEELIAVRVTVG